MAEKLQPHSQKNHWKGLWPSAVCTGAFYYAIAVKPGCRRTHSGTQELLSYTAVCAILIWRKFANTVSQILQVALSIENKWCGKTQISIRPQKLQHLDQYLMKPGHLDEICWKDNELFLKWGAGCSMHEYMGRKKIKYVQSAWFTTVPTLVFYSVLF